MADRYTRSTDGNNADSGATWALAKADALGVAAIDTAGDRLFFSQAHNESTAGAVAIVLAGTLASPSQMLCGDDAAEPPTALATGATITTTGANALSIEGYAYVYGFKLNCSTGASQAQLGLGAGASFNPQWQKYENCELNVLNTHASSRIDVRADGASQGVVEFENCTFGFGAAGQVVNFSGSLGFVRGGGASPSGTATPTALFSPNSVKRLYIDGFDFSGYASTVSLIRSTSGAARVYIRNCELPASWSGNLFGSAPGVSGLRGEMYNCDSADTNYKIWVEDWMGVLRDEATVVMTAGASDGDTTFSWRITTTANPEYPLLQFFTPEIFGERITSVGSSKTATVEILHFGSAPLNDDETWLDIQYLGTSGVPLALFADDCKADVLATAAAQATSTVAWDSLVAVYNPATNYVVGEIVKPTTPNTAIYRLETDAGTTAVEPTWGTTDGGTTVDAAGRTWRRCTRQKLEVAFTPQEEGIPIGVIRHAKPSFTVYANPFMSLGSSGTERSYQLPGAGQINTVTSAGGGSDRRSPLVGGIG